MEAQNFLSANLDVAMLNKSGEGRSGASAGSSGNTKSSNKSSQESSEDYCSEMHLASVSQTHIG